MKNQLLVIAVIASSLAGAVGCDRNDTTAAPAPAPKTDNTAANKVDRDYVTKTPGDQGESSADIKISAEIRRSVMDDKGLSLNAHNAKIITDKGVVTLRGVVESSAEKDSVESKAKAVGGVVSVDNQLEIKTP